MEKVKSKFSLAVDIPNYMVDRHLRLRPSSFMQYAEQMAVIGADGLSFSDADLKAHGLNVAWVLARMHFHYVRTPMRYEGTTMWTWHKGLNGLYFVRDYQMCDAQGTPIVNATSSWIIMDLESRRMVRPEDLVGLISPEPQCSEDAIAELSPKIVMPRRVEPTLIGEHTVSYSDIDINQHANNTKYIAWALDALDLDKVSEHEISDIYINFNREAHPGEKVLLYETPVPGGHIVEGQAEGQQVFICKILFKDLQNN